MSLSVEQKLAIEQLITEHEEFDCEYGIEYITIETLKEEFLPKLLEIISPK